MARLFDFFEIYIYVFIKMDRYFTVEDVAIDTVVNNSLKGGRYVAKTPAFAAKKAAHTLLNNAVYDSVSFSIRETTANSKKQRNLYSAVRRDNGYIAVYRIKNKGFATYFGNLSSM
jgi:hypothetical protein